MSVTAAARADHFSVRIIVRDKGTHWLAQCAEFDVAAQGESFEDAVRAMGRTLISQMLLDVRVGKTPLQDCPEPPPEVLARFETVKRAPATHRFEFPDGSLPPAFMLNPELAEMRVYRA